jgi:hypothetical protein
MSEKWYKMFDSFMVSQILQEVSITIVFMVYSLSWCYMLCLLQEQAWLRPFWLSWLGRCYEGSGSSKINLGHGNTHRHEAW